MSIEQFRSSFYGRTRLAFISLLQCDGLIAEFIAPIGNQLVLHYVIDDPHKQNADALKVLLINHNKQSIKVTDNIIKQVKNNIKSTFKLPSNIDFDIDIKTINFYNLIPNLKNYPEVSIEFNISPFNNITIANQDLCICQQIVIENKVKAFKKNFIPQRIQYINKLIQIINTETLKLIKEVYGISYPYDFSNNRVNRAYYLLQDINKFIDITEKYPTNSSLKSYVDELLNAVKAFNNQRSAQVNIRGLLIKPGAGCAKMTLGYNCTDIYTLIRYALAINKFDTLTSMLIKHVIKSA